LNHILQVILILFIKPFGHLYVNLTMVVGRIIIPCKYSKDNVRMKMIYFRNYSKLICSITKILCIDNFGTHKFAIKIDDFHV